MTDTFIWPVHSTASGGGELLVAEAKLGDGYRQTMALGLNPDVQKWSVTVNGDLAFVRDTVLAFVRSHVGMAFYWKPPAGVTGLYTCNSYKPTKQGGALWTLDLEFEQAFKP